MSKAASEQKALQAVQEYMKSQNRPYSATDVLNNLHKEYGKAQIQKSLDSLVVSGVLREKIVSKQRIYWADQESLPLPDAQQVAKITQQIADSVHKLSSLQSHIKSLECEMKELGSTLTKAELCANLSDLESCVAKKKEKLTRLQSADRPVISSKEKEMAEKENKTALVEWKRRKRMAKEMLDAVMENCPKKRKDIVEEIGIELDDGFCPSG